MSLATPFLAASARWDVQKRCGLKCRKPRKNCRICSSRCQCVGCQNLLVASASTSIVKELSLKDTEITEQASMMQWRRRLLLYRERSKQRKSSEINTSCQSEVGDDVDGELTLTLTPTKNTENAVVLIHALSQFVLPWAVFYLQRHIPHTAYY